MFFVPDVAMDEHVDEQEDGPRRQAPPGCFTLGVELAGLRTPGSSLN